MLVFRMTIGCGLFLILLASAAPPNHPALTASGVYLLFSLGLLAGACLLPPETKDLRLRIALGGDIALLGAGLYLSPELAMLLDPTPNQPPLSAGILLITALAASLAALLPAHRQSARMRPQPISDPAPDHTPSPAQETTVPLWSVVGMADLLLRTPLTVEQQELAGGIRWMAQRLGAQTHRQRTTAHDDISDPPGADMAIELRQLLDSVVQSLHHRISQRSQQVTLQMDDGVPTRIRGDAVRLRLLLSNLLGHALVGLKDGGKMSWQIQTNPARDGFLSEPIIRFEFKTGALESSRPGHAAATKAPYLAAITRQLAEQISGRLGMDIRPDGDATLWLELPIGMQGMQAAPGPHATLRNLRVLSVTPNDALSSQLQAHIQSWQAQQTACPTSLQAFAELLTANKVGKPYAAVLIDTGNLDMPPVQFARMLRQEPSLNAVALIALAPPGDSASDRTDPQALFDASLQVPPDKTLLFNALHEGRTAPADNHKVARLIDRYGQVKSAQPALEILLAAADKTNRMYVRKILERAGHRVYVVENGEQALNALDIHRFDVAVMEMHMPVMNGIEAIKLYRFTHLHDTWMPFIILVADADPDAIRQCRRADVDLYLTGPVKPHELLDHIKQVGAEKTSDVPAPAASSRPAGNAYQRLQTTYLDQTVLGQATLSELEKLGAGKDFVSNLINNFLQDSDFLLAQMESAHHLQQYQSYIDLAHTFKDSAGNLGALAIYNLSVSASRLREAEFLTEGGALVTAIRKAFDLTRQALMNYLSRDSDPVARQ